MAEDKIIGAYICKGCGLGDRLNIEQLSMIAEREGKANIVRSHDFLCHEDGVAMIKNDIENEGVNRVVLGACSRRAKTEAFNFNSVALARANLREGVIWTRPDNDDAQETTQEMAEDYVRMACAESKFMQVPKTNEAAMYNKKILVVGGGVSGITAALEAEAAGYPVTMIEKSAELGGMMASLHLRIPDKAPYSKPVTTGLEGMVTAVNNNANIDVYLNTTVIRTSGAPGRFSVEIASNDGTSETINVGAIIQTSGFTPHDISALPKYAYKKSADIVTQSELEALVNTAKDRTLKRPSDNREIKTVAFIQCVGQRSTEEGHLPYCSGHCCLTSIKQAMYFKNANPEIDTNILYTDLRTPGSGGEEFYRSGQDQGIIFTKGDVSQIIVNDGSLSVQFKDLILNEDITTNVDLVVLANGMAPNSGVNIDTEVEENTTEHIINADSILNLTYRQGKDLPQLKYGFNDSHFICFPYETRRTGIYAAGPTRRPMDILQSKEDATGAALKAIQAIENSGKGRAAHPRTGDLSFPSFQKAGCTQCKRCTVECPFGAIDEDEERYPVFNEARCRRCGTCMGACPVRVISFENYSIDTVGQQIKAIDIPDEFDEKPRILVLACENDAYPALDMAGANRIEYSAFIRIIPVRCLGSINLIWVTDALNNGFDGIMLMGCKKGDNYQCHFVKGSELAHERMGKVSDTLETLDLESERVSTHEVAITDIHRIPELFKEMVDTIDRIGLSPLKF